MKCRLILIAAVLSPFSQPQEAPLLAPGSSLEREIQPGQVHTYRLSVERGMFVHVKAAQLGSDVAIRLMQADGKRYSEVDRLPYEGFEDLPWIAPEAGECTIEIRAGQRSSPGRYRMEVAVRAPTESDRSRVAAFTASWIDGPALRAKHTAAASREAAAKYESAAAAAHKAGDPRWEAYALSEWAAVLGQFGEYAKARDLLERSLDLRRGVDERYSVTVSLNGLGMMNSSLGENRRAVEFYEQSLEIRRQAGDRAGQAVVLNNLGNAYKSLSNHEKAIEYLTQALALRREAGDRAGEANTLSSLGSVHFVSGDFQAALDRYTEAKNLRATLNDKMLEAGSAHVLGNVYYALGRSAEAQQYWKEAESVFRKAGDNPNLASLLYAMGMDHARRSDHAGAVTYLEEALTLHRQMSLGVAAANDLSAICRSFLATGETEKAQARASEGIELSRKIGFQIGAGSSAECLGRVELAKGNVDGARARFSEALEMSRTTTSRENESLALSGLAEVERRRGNLAEAIRYMENANALTAVGRAQVNDPNLRASYRASRSNGVDFETSLLMEMHGQQPTGGYDVRAFNLVEQWRARSLAEMIHETRAELRQELTPAQRQREDLLLASITRIQRQLFQEGVPAARQRELKESLSPAERELDLFQNELRRAGNRYAAGQYAETLNAEQIRQRMLDPDTALIEYALGEARSYAWVLTSSGVASAVLPARGEMERSVEAYRKMLAEPVGALNAATTLARADVEGRKLYRMLVAPLENAVGSRKRLVIVPDGVLAYLPFETLGGASRLIERLSISYAPSASALAALRDRELHRTAPERMLLAFADPLFDADKDRRPQLVAYRERGFAFTSLPNSRREVAGIRSLFAPEASRVYFGAEASERSLRAENLQSYRFLHFAVHGYLTKSSRRVRVLYWRSKRMEPMTESCRRRRSCGCG